MHIMQLNVIEAAMLQYVMIFIYFREHFLLGEMWLLSLLP